MKYEIATLPYHQPRQRAVSPELRNTLALAQIDGGSEIVDRSIFAKSLVVGVQTWNHNLTWTAIDYNTASWSSGSIQLSDGTSYAIDAGNTGNISAKTYVYFDETSTLKTTTDYLSAISDVKIMLAVVEPVTSGEGDCVVTAFNSPGTTIDGDKITTGKIQSQDGLTYFDLSNDKIQISNPSGTTVIDPYGVVSTANFGSANVKTSPAQQFTSTTYADVTNAYLDVTLTRAAKVLILSGCDLYFFFNGGDCIATLEVGLKIGSNSPVKSMQKRGEDKSGYVLGGHVSTHFMHSIQSLSSGTTRIKLQGRRVDASGVGTPTGVVLTADLSVVVLGN